MKKNSAQKQSAPAIRGSVLPTVAALIAVSMLAASVDLVRAQEPKIYIGEVYSSSYHVDGIYKPMMGPSSTVGVRLMGQPQEELIWIVGYRAQVVDAESLQPVSQEYMCHANLELTEGELYLGRSFELSPRLFTLSQGQQEIRFPAGFGIPALSGQRLTMNSQVLNLNKSQIDLDVKHRVEILLTRDKETTKPMEPLYQRSVQVMKSLDEARYYGLDAGEGDGSRHGASCSVGQPASEDQFVTDGLDQRFTAHWVVEPGREVSRNNVTRWLNLHRDTTVHYIAAHMHPYGESVELFDLTQQKAVFKSNVRGSRDRVGIDQVGLYSSAQGVPLYRDHEYEIISVYNNTSDEPVDAMAVMFLYMLDHDFRELRESKGSGAGPTGSTPGSGGTHPGLR